VFHYVECFDRVIGRKPIAYPAAGSVTVVRIEQLYSDPIAV
jgi:hypothetical protein